MIIKSSAKKYVLSVRAEFDQMLISVSYLNKVINYRIYELCILSESRRVEIVAGVKYSEYGE